MNMQRILSLLLLFSSSVIIEQTLQAGGGAVAGGVFGGLALGSIIASSNRRPRETVIYERQPEYVPVYVVLGDDGFYYDQDGNQVPGPRGPANRRRVRRGQQRDGSDYRRQQQDHREVRELERNLEQADLLD